MLIAAICQKVKITAKHSPLYKLKLKLKGKSLMEAKNKTKVQDVLIFACIILFYGWVFAEVLTGV